MKTGIILEINEQYLTLLTPDGQFLRAKNLQYPYEIGQEIQFIPIQEQKLNLRKWYRTAKGKALVAAAFAVMIGASTFVPMYQDNQVYAYMTIDDGASIELEVNKDLQVIGVNPYNDKGEQVVKAIDHWQDQDLSDVSEAIITEIKKQKVGDGQVVMSSTILANDQKEEVEKKLKQEIDEIQSIVTKNESSVTLVEGTKAERKKAKKQGVTVGKLKEKEIARKVKEEKQLNKKQLNKDKQAQKELKREKQKGPQNQSPITELPKNQKDKQERRERNEKLNKHDKEKFKSEKSQNDKRQQQESQRNTGGNRSKQPQEKKQNEQLRQQKQNKHYQENQQFKRENRNENYR